MPFARYFCIFINVGLEETINRAADALQKSQNGADIPDKPRFVQNIGLKRNPQSNKTREYRQYRNRRF